MSSMMNNPTTTRETRILDCRKIARQLQREIAVRVAEARQRFGRTPKLAAVLVGADPASKIYVGKKETACAEAGMASQVDYLDAATTTEQLRQHLQTLNEDPAVNGILLQLPLPAGLDTVDLLDSIDWRKDVDAFHPHNVGLMSQGRPRFLPCTPLGVVHILARSGIQTAGKQVVVLGRSDIVGKPMAHILVQRDGPCGPQFANATVTICHSQTPELASVTRLADILVAAIGKPHFVTATHVQPGATVVDVGINRLPSGRVVGDVDSESLLGIAAAITPVPGGVGPLTVTMLLNNTLAAAIAQWTS